MCIQDNSIYAFAEAGPTRVPFLNKRHLKVCFCGLEHTTLFDDSALKNRRSLWSDE